MIYNAQHSSPIRGQLATNYLMSKPLFRSLLVAGRHFPLDHSWPN